MTPAPLPRLHVVTDDAVLAAPDFSERATSLLREHGARVALHVRGPGSTGRRLYDVARALLPAAHEAGAWLLVNDRVDVALVTRCDGAQLGARSLPAPVARRLLGARARIGASVHTPEEARSAAAEGAADFLVFGAVHATASHPGRAPAGVAALAAAVRAAVVPVVAIGGVTPERVPELVRAGATGVAVLSGVWAAPDAAAAASSYLAALDR